MPRWNSKEPNDPSILLQRENFEKVTKILVRGAAVDEINAHLGRSWRASGQVGRIGRQTCNNVLNAGWSVG